VWGQAVPEGVPDVQKQVLHQVNCVQRAIGLLRQTMQSAPLQQLEDQGRTQVHVSAHPSRTNIVTIPENLACVKWAGTRPTLFGPARARPDMVGNGPELARSMSHAVLGPGRQPVGRARHGFRPMWPVKHEHGLLGPIHHAC
jgi:hypothetical protein